MQDDEEIVYHEKHYNGGGDCYGGRLFFKGLLLQG